MSRCSNRNSGWRMCSTFVSDPVSRLSTQITRWPLASRWSQRCDPRNPAPPVTSEVGIRERVLALSARAARSLAGVARTRGSGQDDRTHADPADHPPVAEDLQTRPMPDSLALSLLSQIAIAWVA